MPANTTVRVVDDNDAIRNALCLLVRSVGLHAAPYASATEFLKHDDPHDPGCLVVDVRMKGMSGLELQQRLIESKHDTPIVMISGHGDIGMAVRAMKAGAVDFIEKPFNDQVLLDSINRALEKDMRQRQKKQQRLEMLGRLERLSGREREVLELLIAGKPNKVIAHDLGLSHKTIEAHRSNILTKMQVRSVVDLTRMVLTHDVLIN